MKLPAGLHWMPAQWRWAALSEGDRLLLVLSLSLLLHLPLFMRLTHEGSLRGQPLAMSVRLGQAAPPKTQPPVSKPVAPSVQPVPPSRHQSRVLLAATGKTRLAQAASAAVASPPPVPEPHVASPAAAPHEIPEQASQPASEQAQTSFTGSASVSQDDSAGAQRLGLDFYYAARQLDVLALEQLPIQLVEPYGVGMDDVEVNLRVYINEQGGVDAVQLVSARPAGVEGPLLDIFRQAKFYPAMRDGHPVKSFKLIRIGPQGDAVVPGN
uniref:TonB C-terminal domain-containing protein n=1 Tax=Anopheles coluzzii TaxID=1518534 RepID=A0A8W7PIG6_ANOCL